MNDESTTLDSADIISSIEAVCRKVDEKKEWLSRLDAACGDGDHGVSMARGFSAVATQLPSLAGESPGTIFKKTGMTLVSVIGGATGPLVGTLFIEAGKAAGARTEIDTQILAKMFRAGLEGVCRRGGAVAGEKTMVDALIPLTDALEKAAAEYVPPCEALRWAAVAAREGASATASMVARQGKARYLGERALGHEDAGAHSIVVIIEAFAEGAAS